MSNTRATLVHDAKCAAVASLVGLIAAAGVDFCATLWVAHELTFGTVFRLFGLELALCSLFFVCVMPLQYLAAVVYRGLKQGGGIDEGLWGGPTHSAQPSRAAAWVWSIGITSVVFMVISTNLTIRFGKTFKEPQLTALLLACVQLLVLGVLITAAMMMTSGLGILAQKIQRWLDVRCTEQYRALRLANPLGVVPVAVVCLSLLVWPLVAWVLRVMPQLGPVMPWRLVLVVGGFGIGSWSTSRVLGKGTRTRNLLWPTEPKAQRNGKRVALMMALLVVPAMLLWGADRDTKSLVVSSSPPLSKAMDWVRKATDFDRDGFGFLLGENDCDIFDGEIHPLARDIPDNGIDENCDGRDFVLGNIPSYQKGVQTMPVPAAYQGDWNVLFLTVDTVRFDHTTFGGYERNTTPELQKFAKRSANFLFANAPSAGTMASIPSIMTSKFFHSGVALDEDVPHGAPPRIKDSNTLLAELFKDKGYRTGSFLTHDYFNDWGMDQGIDEYDNSLGKVREPASVTSPKLTDLGISWIGKQDSKWFLWMHYFDPHGYYVSHPGEVQYGEEEKDLYDGELHFTDKHIARLLDYIARSDDSGKTIIVLTSDHGDAFGEHGYKNHAVDLHKELIHVPLIFYVPNIEPREIAGAVSPIDIFPTLAALIGADVEDLNLEGVSLVPQLFYGQDAHERIVFSETNYPKPLRAVVTSEYKLILDLKNNISRLYHLAKDPLEKRNVWSSDKAGYNKMRGYLNEWLERVVYNRDTSSNQAFAKIQQYVASKRPDNAIPVAGASVDEGKIVIDSFVHSNPPFTEGEKAVFSVFFRTVNVTTEDLRIQLEVWLEGPGSSPLGVKSAMSITGKGMFPSSRWHPGELIRDTFTIKVPTTWASAPEGTKAFVGIRFQSKNRNLKWTGARREGTKDLVILGEVPLVP